jgi:hypothetical protein
VWGVKGTELQKGAYVRAQSGQKDTTDQSTGRAGSIQEHTTMRWLPAKDWEPKTAPEFVMVVMLVCAGVSLALVTLLGM